MLSPAMMQAVVSRQPPYPEVILADNPVMYIRFDDTAGTDARAYGRAVHTATYTDSPTLAREGPLLGDGSAVGLNIAAASNERAVVDHHANFNLTTAWTVEAWVKVVAASGFGDLSSKNSIELRCDVQLATSATNEWAIGVGGGIVAMGTWDASFSHLSDWRLFHGAYDEAIPGGDDIEAFLDTIEASASPADSTTVAGSNAAALLIGNRAALDRDFRGDVAEYALYDRRLGAGEREKHFLARDMKVSPGDYWSA